MNIPKVNEELTPDFYCLHGRREFAEIIDNYLKYLKGERVSQAKACIYLGITHAQAKELREAAPRPFTLETIAKLHNKIPKLKNGRYSATQYYSMH
ncbi:MAG: hypothetical protein AAFU78_21670, partial [Cyanobacteria bacterium J06633_2]